MKIHVFSIMHNEEYLLPYFLRHYSLFADEIYILNDHSTDKTVTIAKKRAIVLDFPYNRGLNEEDFSQCFEDFYKKYSRGKADWVICVDADEFIYHDDVSKRLSELRKLDIKLVKPTGYTMISEKLPNRDGQIYDEIDTGIRTREYDKPVIFDPNIDVNFGNGRHSIKINGNAIEPVESGLLLLHFRYLSRDYWLKRSKLFFNRMDIPDRIKKYRIKKGLSWYDLNLSRSIKLL